MAISKSAGTTPSERLLAKLCDQSFLGFWSYPNTFRDQGGGKEHCDLMVVCGGHIVLFSDKTCAFPHTGDVKLDWSRWFRDCIAESAKQLRGAERWLRTNPKRIFLDSNCTQPFPLSLDQIANAKVHRVIVALGAQERCKQHWGGSGSLRIVPAVSGNAHHDLKNCDVQPFTVGSLSDDPGHFHILDDFTLPLLLKELDTITDFVSYLEFKEALLRARKVEMIAGEENLLALFLRRA